MRFKVTIDCDNAAFGDDPAIEVARILRELSQEVDDGTPVPPRGAKRLHDFNGNRVGEAKWIDCPPVRG